MSDWRARGWCLCDTPPGESALAVMQCNTITILGNGDGERRGSGDNDITRVNTFRHICDESLWRVNV